jgi:hypothetical protein
MRSFQAQEAATVNIAVGATSGRVLVCNTTGPLQVRVMNNGTATAWFAFGDSTVVASGTADKPIGSGGTEVFTVQPPGNGALYAAVIAAGATGNIYFTPGVGL